MKDFKKPYKKGLLTYVNNDDGYFIFCTPGRGPSEI